MQVQPGFFLRRWALRLVGLAFAFGATSVVLGFEARRAGTSWLALAIFGLGVACLYFEWRTFVRADRVADGYVGETKVYRILRPLEAEGYSILGPRRTGYRRADIDQIVVGPTGVFAIEVKAWNGNLEWRGERLYSGWRDRTRQVRKSVWHAMHVKEQIPRELGVGWVEAVTVFAEAAPRVGCRHRKNYWAVPAEDLPGFIKSRRSRLSNEECAYIASTIH